MPQAAPVTIAVLPARSGSLAFRDGVQTGADLVRVAAELLEPRQLGQDSEPEDPLEQRRRAIADGAEVLLAARFAEQAPLDQAGDDAVRRSRHGCARSPAASTDRGRRRSPASRARPGEPPLGGRSKRREQASAASREARKPSRRRRARARSRCDPRGSARSSSSSASRCARARPRSPRELVHGQRLRRDDEQRLDRAGELVDGLAGIRRSGRSMRPPFARRGREILIGANGAAWASTISPCLRSSSSARNATALSARDSPTTSWSKSNRRRRREQRAPALEEPRDRGKRSAMCAVDGRGGSTASSAEHGRELRRVLRRERGLGARGRERRRPEAEEAVAPAAEPLGEPQRRLLRAAVLGEATRELLGRLLGLELLELGVLLGEERARLQLEQRRDQDQELAAGVEVELVPLGEVLDEREHDPGEVDSRSGTSSRRTSEGEGRRGLRTRRGRARAREQHGAWRLPWSLPRSWVARSKRGKDAGSARSRSATGATEDAASRSLIAGQGPGRWRRERHNPRLAALGRGRGDGHLRALRHRSAATRRSILRRVPSAAHAPATTRRTRSSGRRDDRHPAVEAQAEESCAGSIRRSSSKKRAEAVVDDVQGEERREAGCQAPADQNQEARRREFQMNSYRKVGWKSESLSTLAAARGLRGRCACRSGGPREVASACRRAPG